MLQTIWFLLIGVLLIGYSVLDGFDLGLGSLYLFFGRTAAERSLLLGAIGPVWGANEVWLLTAGGALFAAFPPVYATVFSGFYLAMMLVLFALILRAAAVEYRTLASGTVWQRRWDVLFSLGSFLPALLFGVALGNVAEGLPLDAAGNYTGGFLHLLNPYALLLGLLGLAAFLTQGGTFAALKTEGDLQARAKQLAGRFGSALALLFLLASAYTLSAFPARATNYLQVPVLFLLPLAVLAALVFLLSGLKARRYRQAFIASSVAIATMILTLFLSLYPQLVPATVGRSLTIFNSSSSALTLRTMLLIAAVGMPIVLIYTVYIYRVFRGKVRPQDVGY